MAGVIFHLYQVKITDWGANWQNWFQLLPAIKNLMT